MGGLRGWVVALSADEMWQEAGEGSQMLRSISLFREKRKGICSHSFCLRFGAVFPHENSANKKRPCHSLMKPREVLAMQAA